MGEELWAVWKANPKGIEEKMAVGWHPLEEKLKLKRGMSNGGSGALSCILLGIEG